MTGFVVKAGAWSVVRVTLSKVAVLTVPSAWLVTARPAFTLAAMVIFTAEPICVQASPSAEAKEYRSFPKRTMRTQLFGAALSAGPATLLDAPPTAARY